VKWIFWSSVALLAYTYVGYAGWLWLRVRWRPRPVRHGSATPLVSVVIVARNEESFLKEKIQNLLALDYPGDRLQVVVVSDGSTDRTESILRECARDSGICILLNQLSNGKASGLNDGVGAAAGEVIVFTDVRQKIESGAVRLLVENFADLEVGCASGELMLGDLETGETAKGMGLYWRIEKKIREWESNSGSVVGATGALYAVRRQLIPAVPTGTILDDVYIPMHVIRQSRRVVFDSRARAWDSPDLGGTREFARKVRTLSGNYQLLQICPWLLGKQNPLRFEFVSHKLLRLVAPFALLTALVSSLFVRDAIYRGAFLLQAAFYALSLLGMVRLKRGLVARMADAAFTFVALNTAALVAFGKFVRGRKIEWGH
jgi:biofilm PGA synthesis N-glycosyltransferase PgaC